MNKFSEFICKHKISVFVLSIILLILSFFGIHNTKVNYDILVYLPDDIKTIEGQNILTDDFGIGSYAVAISEKLNSKEILDLEDKIKEIDGVNKVISAYDALGTEIPVSILPVEIREKVNNKDNDVIFITFDDSTSSTRTLNAVNEIRHLSNNKIKQGGMSSLVLDTMELSEKEIFIYILIAVILCITMLELSLDSYVLPFILLGNIGLAIIYNLGTNVFLGEISYITKSLVAVLQLGVTTDYSIFLYHAYQRQKEKIKDNEKAMVAAMKETFTSVIGSSLTTIVGFLVLCTMTLTLGKDLGIVMAKGVLIGVITVLTIFPSYLLIFDNLINKTKHKKINYTFTKLNNFIIKYNKVFLVIFLILLVPFYRANSRVDVYYKLDRSLPDTLESIKANNMIKEKFNIASPEIVLINNKLDSDIKYKISDEISNIKGVDFVLSLSKLEDMGIDSSILPKDFLDIVKQGNYEIMLLNSLYDIATPELNNQIELINNVLEKYDKSAILAGEGSLMKDMITISDKDFRNVNCSSVFCIFIVLFFVLKSFSLPLLLITVIEFAIFVNLGISYFNGTTLPFIAPIVLGTIQLGATIDYAILMTTTYLKDRFNGKDKKLAITDTINNCAPSIFLSGMCFFLATFGVGVYSKIDMISSICFLISRGALISMLVVIIVLPSVLLTCDKLIMKTTKNRKKGNDKMKNNLKKAVATCFAILLIFTPVVNAKEMNDNNEYHATKIENKSIVNSKITYKLNGENKNVNDMIGKKGKVEINIKYTNTELTNTTINNKKETIYKPYVTLFVTNLTKKYNKNITIENGKVDDNGRNYFLMGITTPDLDKSLKINKLAKYNEINISYDTNKFELPNIYNLTLPLNISSLSFDSVDSLYNNINLLRKNMDKIAEGSNELNDGINLLSSEVSKSINSLKNKTVSSDDINKIKQQVLEEMIKNLNGNFQEELANKAWAQTKKEIDSGKDKTVENNVESKIMNVLASYLGGKENLGYYGACAKGNTTACLALESKGYKVEDINRLKASLVKEFSSLAKETSYYVGEKVSKSVSKEVSLGVAINVANSLTEKLVPIIFDEVKQELVPNFEIMNQNIVKLKTGSNKLNSSVNKYNKEGIKVLSTKSNEIKRLTNRLDVVLNVNKDDTNYVELIDSIKVPEKEEKINVTNEKTTLWQRIKNLFN